MDSGNQKYRTGNIYNILRCSLITLSVVCTLIFLFYQLHNPEYERQVSRAISEADAEYDRRLGNISADFDKRLQGIGGEVDAWQQQLAVEVQNVRGGVAEGVKFKAYEGLYNKAVSGLNSRRTQLELERAERVSDLEEWHEEGVARVKEKLRTDSSSHNPMISAVLQVLGGTPQYSMKYYTLSIVLFSLLVSVVLELIIVYVFHVLAVNNGDMFEAEMVRKPV